MLRSLLVVVALGLTFVVPGVRAQDVDAPLSAAARLLVPEARARLATSDTTLTFRTQPVPNGRYDVDAGVLRAAYRIEGGLVVPFAAPDAAARAYLKAEAARFGWRPEADDLVLASVVEGQERIHGTSVAGGAPVATQDGLPFWEGLRDSTLVRLIDAVVPTLNWPAFSRKKSRFSG